MRKQLFVPMLVGMLALGAAQAFAQSATVVMRNGDRVRADVIDMGRDFTLNVNGQTRQVPIGDIVLHRLRRRRTQRGRGRSLEGERG